MTVYVDDVRHKYGRMIMCHMWADTLAELLQMANQIGVQRKWLQEPPKASWTHFDISISKKNMAIKFGAKLTDKYGPLEFESKAKLKSEDKRVRQSGRIMLDRISNVRKAQLRPTS